MTETASNVVAMPLKADRKRVARFARVIFGQCTPWQGRANLALRGFGHGARAGVILDEWVRFDGGMVGAAETAATRVAAADGVFCPPLALFGPAEKGAGEDNVLVCPVLTVELDSSPALGAARIRTVAGPETLCVKSGGVWRDPEEDWLQDKLHLHYVLSAPASTPEALKMARACRRMMRAIAGGDRSAEPLCHPIRWPGSWHVKNAVPVMCDIIGADGPLVDLETLHTRLTLECLEAGIELDEPRVRGERLGFKTKEPLQREQLMGLARDIPNAVLDWEAWNLRGLSFYDSSHGSADGLEAFDAWSQKIGAAYDPEAVEARWTHYDRSPPSELSAGTLIRDANAAKGVAPGPRLEFDVVEDAAAVDAQQAEATKANLFGTAEDAAAPDYVRELNGRHAFVVVNGSTGVVTVDHKGVVSIMAKNGFMDRYANDRVEIEVKTGNKVETKAVSKAALWWVDPYRRQAVEGFDFSPEGSAPGVFNLWRGWPLAPGSGSRHERMLVHIREVVCAGDEAAYRYLVGWLAHLVQRPGDKPGVAVVLRGAKGAGKDTLGRWVREMMLPYAFRVSSQEQVTGKFNSHLVGKLFLHLEEALWAGDRAAESALKALITSEDMTCEPKGVNAYMVRSCVRLFMTTNEDWAVPASHDERRYFALNVSPARVGDRSWFGALLEDLGAGGPADLFGYLRRYDLSGFEVRDVPVTDALQEQKEQSFRGFEKWWNERLQDGQDWAEEGDWEAGEVVVAKRELRRLYLEWLKSHRFQGEPEAEYVIGRKLHEFTGGCVAEGPRNRVGGERVVTYRIPSLTTCRAAWKVRNGG